MKGLGFDWYRRPELILADVIMRAARGEHERHLRYYRARVLAVDIDGGLLQNPSGQGSLKFVERDGTSKSFDAMIGPSNPPGSIKARILTDGFDRLIDDQDARVFWPMLPTDQLAIPISPGEHVYVFFEGTGTEHGLWVSRVSGQDSANSFTGTDSYSAPSGQMSGMDSFEPNGPDYDTSDEHAGLAPPVNGMSFFGEG